MNSHSSLLQIVAYQPEIAQNLGNMIRTCACLNLSLAVVEPCGFPFSMKALKRSAMDYADIAEVTRHNDWAQYCENIPRRRILLTTKTTQSYLDFQFHPGDALVLGQESAGVPEYVAKDCDALITIPMPGGGRSLNVSTSMAIVASEALRQLREINTES